MVEFYYCGKLITFQAHSTFFDFYDKKECVIRIINSYQSHFGEFQNSLFSMLDFDKDVDYLYLDNNKEFDYINYTYVEI